MYTYKQLNKSVVMIRFFKLFFLIPVLASSFKVSAQTYTPAPANLAARKAFQDDKFGMFIHWGPSSVLVN